MYKVINKIPSVTKYLYCVYIKYRTLLSNNYVLTFIAIKNWNILQWEN